MAANSRRTGPGMSRSAPPPEPRWYVARVWTDPFWPACAAAYALILWLFLPTLSFAPVSLDDHSLLSALENQPFSSVWRYDHFGHFRPLKNVLFWLLCRDFPELALWRGGVLCVFISTVCTVQYLTARAANSKWLGLATATLWAVHPTTATVVSWLSTVNLSVCVLALLLYIACSDRALSSTKAQLKGRETLFFALSLVALATALLSHELALLGPVLLIVSERLLRRRAIDRTIAAGSFAVVALYLVARALSDGSSRPYRFEAVAPSLMAVSAARYFLQNALLWLWPFGRFGVLLHDQPDKHLLLSGVSWLGLIGASIPLWKLRHRDRVLTLGAALFAASLAPFSNFVPLGNTPIAVYYLYLAGVGLSLVMCRTLFLAVQRVGVGRRSIARAIATTCFIGLVVAQFFESRQVVAAWGDSAQLFLATHENYPDNVEALVNLSSVYLERHQHQAADAILTEAAELEPDNLLVLRNRLSLAFVRRDHQRAVDLLDARSTLSNEPELLVTKGEALAHLGRHRDAGLAFQLAFERADPVTQPEYRHQAGYRLAVALLQTGQPHEATALIDKLLVDYPGSEELRQIQSLLR